MKINALRESFINISGKIYSSEFINLVNIKEKRLFIDEETLFLSKKQKEELNLQQIKGYDNAVYIFKSNDVYGIIADVPIHEYEKGNIKCHELTIPDTIQKMLSNLYFYNSEAAPILLTHKKKIDYKAYIDSGKYIDKFTFNNQLEIYVFIDRDAKNITDEFLDEDSLFVADGHHRLYTTSLSRFKSSVLSCLISFDYINIFPIHRVLPNVDVQTFELVKDYILKKFETTLHNNSISKGQICIEYRSEKLIVNLNELNSDAFSNNDIFRLNTQIITQAFRNFNPEKIEYISSVELEKHRSLLLNNNEVIIETYPLSKEEFIEYASRDSILAPKSTWFEPKFPSFLIFKRYK